MRYYYLINTILVIDMFVKENNVLSEQSTVAFIVVYTILSTVAGIFRYRCNNDWLSYITGLT